MKFKKNFFIVPVICAVFLCAMGIFCINLSFNSESLQAEESPNFSSFYELPLTESYYKDGKNYSGAQEDPKNIPDQAKNSKRPFFKIIVAGYDRLQMTTYNGKPAFNQSVTPLIYSLTNSKTLDHFRHDGYQFHLGWYNISDDGCEYVGNKKIDKMHYGFSQLTDHNIEQNNISLYNIFETVKKDTFIKEYGEVTNNGDYTIDVYYEINFHQDWHLTFPYVYTFANDYYNIKETTSFGVYRDDYEVKLWDESNGKLIKAKRASEYGNQTAIFRSHGPVRLEKPVDNTGATPQSLKITYDYYNADGAKINENVTLQNETVSKEGRYHIKITNGPFTCEEFDLYIDTSRPTLESWNIKFSNVKEVVEENSTPVYIFEDHAMISWNSPAGLVPRIATVIDAKGNVCQLENGKPFIAPAGRYVVKISNPPLANGESVDSVEYCIEILESQNPTTNLNHLKEYAINFTTVWWQVYDDISGEYYCFPLEYYGEGIVNEDSLPYELAMSLELRYRDGLTYRGKIYSDVISLTFDLEQNAKSNIKKGYFTTELDMNKYHLENGLFGDYFMIPKGFTFVSNGEWDSYSLEAYQNNKLVKSFSYTNGRCILDLPAGIYEIHEKDIYNNETVYTISISKTSIETVISYNLNAQTYKITNPSHIVVDSFSIDSISSYDSMAVVKINNEYMLMKDLKPKQFSRSGIYNIYIYDRYKEHYSFSIEVKERNFRPVILANNGSEKLTGEEYYSVYNFTFTEYDVYMLNEFYEITLNGTIISVGDLNTLNISSGNYSYIFKDKYNNSISKITVEIKERSFDIPLEFNITETSSTNLVPKDNQIYALYNFKINNTSPYLILKINNQQVNGEFYTDIYGEYKIEIIDMFNNKSISYNINIEEPCDKLKLNINYGSDNKIVDLQDIKVYNFSLSGDLDEIGKSYLYKINGEEVTSLDRIVNFGTYEIYQENLYNNLSVTFTITIEAREFHLPLIYDNENKIDLKESNLTVARFKTQLLPNHLVYQKGQTDNYIYTNGQYEIIVKDIFNNQEMIFTITVNTLDYSLFGGENKTITYSDVSISWTDNVEIEIRVDGLKIETDSIHIYEVYSSSQDDIHVYIKIKSIYSGQEEEIYVIKVSNKQKAEAVLSGLKATGNTEFKIYQPPKEENTNVTDLSGVILLLSALFVLLVILSQKRRASR